VLTDLSAAAPDLREFLDRSARFAEVTRPSLLELGQTAQVGNAAARAARPQVAELRRYARPLLDLAPNLRIVLEDFADPARAVEKDPRSPGGQGYSGAQALLQYIFNQTLVNNGFDELGHIVRSGVFTDRCSPYIDAKDFKKNEERLKICPAWLGPNQPGVTTPDPSADPEAAAAAKRADRRARRRARRDRSAPGTDAHRSPDSRPGAGDNAPPASELPLPPPLRELLERLPDAPAQTPLLPERDVTPLLDFLFAQ
jgi:hypothetical protein